MKPQWQRGSVAIALVIAGLLTVLVALVLAQASALRGAHEDLSQANARADQSDRALETERRQHDLMNRSTLNLVNKLDAQRAKADDLLFALGKVLHGAPDAVLPGSVGRVLRDIAPRSAPVDPAPVARAGEAAAPADPAGGDRETVEGRPVSCKAIAVWAAENIELVSKPNALQLEEVQAAYERQRVLLLLNDVPQ